MNFKFFQENIFHFRYITGHNEIDELINNTPQDVVNCGEIGAYREGIQAAILSIGHNPYHDQLRGEIWNRGFWNATNIIHRR